MEYSVEKTNMINIVLSFCVMFEVNFCVFKVRRSLTKSVQHPKYKQPGTLNKTLGTNRK